MARPASGIPARRWINPPRISGIAEKAIGINATAGTAIKQTTTGLLSNDDPTVPTPVGEVPACDASPSWDTTNAPQPKVTTFLHDSNGRLKQRTSVWADQSSPGGVASTMESFTYDLDDTNTGVPAAFIDSSCLEQCQFTVVEDGIDPPFTVLIRMNFEGSHRR